MKRWKKYLLGVAGIMITAVVIEAWLIFVYGGYVGSNYIYFRSVDVNNKNIELKGGTVASASAFAGYKYEIQGEDLYIRIRYCPLGSKIHPFGDFDIKFDDNKIEKVKYVYLLGDNHNKELLWHR